MHGGSRRAGVAAIWLLLMGAWAWALGALGDPPRASAAPAANGITVIQGAPNHVISVDCSVIDGFHQYFVPYVVTSTSADTLQVRGLSSCNSKAHSRYNTAIGPTTTCGGFSGFQTACGAGLYSANSGVLDQAFLYRNTRYQLFTQTTGIVEIIFYFALDTRYPPGVWTPATQAVSTAVGTGITPTLAYSIDGPSQPTFSITPPLPTGLSIDPVTGVIRGTPTVVHPPTDHTVTATMGAATATATVTVSVATHRVGFHANAPTSPLVTAGTVPAARLAMNDGDAITLPPGPTRLNHGFNGWFTSETDPASKVGDPGDPYTPTQSITLYAQWTPPFVVTYDRQGGGGSGSNTVAPGSSFTLPTTTHAARTFVGWFDAPNGGNLVGAAGASFTPTASTTLYAQWTARLSLFLNSGSLPPGAPSSHTITIPSPDTTVVLPTPTRTGHRFLGWWSSTSGGTLFGHGGDSYTVTQNVNMQARWQALSRVDFAPLYGSLSDGRCEPVSGMCRIWWGPGDPVFHLPAITSDRGLAFDGWFTLASGGTRIGGPGDTLASPSNTTLRPQWTGTRTFDANGGTVQVASRSGKAGTTGSIEVPYRPGFAFGHWVASNPPFGPTALVRSTSQRIIEQTEALTAQWREFPDAPTLQSASLSDDRRTIRLRFTGDLQVLYSVGAGNLCSEFRVVSVPKDAAFDDNVLGRACTVDGPVLEFTRGAGLSTDSTTMTVAYAGRSLAAAGNAGEFVHQTHPVRVDHVGYELAFDGNGGTPAAPRRAIAAGRPLALPGGTRPGLTLAGWFTRASGGDLVGTVDDAFTPTEDTTLFAQWNARVSFDAREGTDPAPVDVNVDSDGPIALPAAERPGFTFAGWFSDESGGQRVGGAGEAFMPAEDTTLFARWRAVDEPVFGEPVLAEPVLLPPTSTAPMAQPQPAVARPARLRVQRGTLRLRDDALSVTARATGGGTVLIRGYRTAGPGKGPVVVCSGTSRITKAGAGTLTCVPTKAARALREKGTLRVRLVLVFVPKGAKATRIVAGRVAMPRVGARPVAVTG